MLRNDSNVGINYIYTTDVVSDMTLGDQEILEMNHTQRKGSI